MIRVLGIEVSPARLATWTDWLAPDRQPFFVTARQVSDWDLQTEDLEPDRQQRDTYHSYAVDGVLRTTWLSEATFMALPRKVRARLVRAQVTHERGAVPTVRAWADVLGPRIREQADGHRFVWWKSLLTDPAAVLPRVLSEDLGPSLHAEVAESTWSAIAGLLPRARELAGTFPDGSGPNCFGTVMAACGVEGAAEEWMQRQPFDAWLAESTTRGGRDAVRAPSSSGAQRTAPSSTPPSPSATAGPSTSPPSPG